MLSNEKFANRLVSCKHRRTQNQLKIKSMTKFKIKLWLTLTIIGLIGIASLLLSDLPLDNLPEKVTKAISPETLKLLILINPSLILIISTVIGTILYDKVKLTIPIFEKLLNKPDSATFSLLDITKQGIILGILAGVLIFSIVKIFEPYLPQVLTDATKDINLNIFTKVLYGGITEELLTRFGLMSLFVWLLFKMFKRLNSAIYWSAIIISAILFALGHLPIVFQAVAEPTLPIYTYIILGNSIGGLIFGFAYWKKGLECVFISHSFAHLTLITLNLTIQ